MAELGPLELLALAIGAFKLLIVQERLFRGDGFFIRDGVFLGAGLVLIGRLSRHPLEKRFKPGQPVFGFNQTQLGAFGHGGPGGRSSLQKLLQPHLVDREALLQFQQPEGEDFSDLGKGLQLVGQPLGAICRLQLRSHGPYQGVWPDGIGGARKRQGVGGPSQHLICNDCVNLWIRSKQTQRICLPPFSAAPAYLPPASHAHDTRQRCPPGHRQP